MATTVKKTERKGASSKKSIVVSKKVMDYGNDPFFGKKAKEMEAVLKKYGLPKS